jgi:4a-hydroxytetrahydrobiopterin dehydratase
MWQETDKGLVKEFTFPDFKSALEFVVQIGALAEKANHHPDIELSWGKVKVFLTTHEARKVTKKDKTLARQINQLFN